MIWTCSLVLLLVGRSRTLGEKVGWDVATFAPLFSLFVIRLVARAQYVYDSCVPL